MDADGLDEWGTDPEDLVGYGQPPVIPLDDDMESGPSVHWDEDNQCSECVS